MKGERLIYIPERHLYALAKSVVGKRGEEIPSRPLRPFDAFETIPDSEIDLDASEFVAIPSVTGLISSVEEDGVKLVDFSAVPEDLLDAARRRGIYVHDMIDADAAGDLDESRVEPRYKGFLDAYRAWMAKYPGATVIASEVAGTALFGMGPGSSILVAGRIDRVMNFGGENVVVDFKSGLAGIGAKIQVGGGYIQIAERMGLICCRGLIVRLKADGSFIEEIVDPKKCLPMMHKVAGKTADPTIKIDLAAMAKDASRIPADLESRLTAAAEAKEKADAELAAVKAEIILATGGGAGIGSGWSLYTIKAQFGVDAAALEAVRPDLARRFVRSVVNLPASAWAIVAETVGDLLDDTVGVESKVDPKVLEMLNPAERAKVQVTTKKGGFGFKAKKAKE